MDLKTHNFEPLISQQVMVLVEKWRAMGMPEEDVQEGGNQCFNMGMIAAQQVQQEPGIQPQGSEQIIPYTLPMAERVVSLFLKGIDQAVLKAFEMNLPSPERWQLIQQVALHVFDQSKQAVVATFGQEETPEIQIPEEQLVTWVGQTGIEALLYFISEYEKQNGPLVRGDEPQMPDLLNSDPDAYTDPDPLAALDAMPVPEPLPEVSEAEMAPQAPEPVADMPPQAEPTDAIPEVHYKYAAISLMLNTMPERRQRKVLQSFQPDEQDIIKQYRNPDMITSRMDLGKVAAHLKRFQSQMGQPGGKAKRNASPAAGAVSQLVSKLPPKRIEKIFQPERPAVRGFVRQFLNPSSEQGEPFELPPGVQEGLVQYIERNFAHELEASR